jgi:hypothetical protein
MDKVGEICTQVARLNMLRHTVLTRDIQIRSNGSVKEWLSDFDCFLKLPDFHGAQKRASIAARSAMLEVIDGEIEHLKAALLGEAPVATQLEVAPSKPKTRWRKFNEAVARLWNN